MDKEKNIQKVKENTYCRKCGKLIKKGRLVSSDGYCFRCDDNRTRQGYHIAGSMNDKRFRDTVKW